MTVREGWMKGFVERRDDANQEGTTALHTHGLPVGVAANRMKWRANRARSARDIRKAWSQWARGDT